MLADSRSQLNWFRAVCFFVGSTAALAAGGCSEDNNPPPQQPGTVPKTSMTVQVSIPQGAAGMGSAAFGVNPLMIQVGTTVVWTNNDTVPHTVTADDGSFDSNAISPGATFSHLFTTTGTFTYFCQIHGKASMNGAVQVSTTVPSPTPSATVSPTPSPSPSPSMSGMPMDVSVSIAAGAVGKGPAAFGTNPLVVHMGTTVTWTNNDSLPHTVTADDGSFDSDSLSTGETFSHTFDAAGTFAYHCKIHGQASMSGAVQVTP